MQAFVIPTIFTAAGNLGTQVQGYTTSMNGLAVSVARAERSLSTLTAPLNGITGSMMGFVGQAAATAAIIGGIVFTGKGMADYQTEISNLSAVTGATGADLDLFKSKIKDVADDTKKSMVAVAQAFTVVDNNMPELHKDAGALAEVTREAVILAKASREELKPAAEALTMSMNQFGHTAAQAGRDVDAMAAGAVFGSSRIGETSEALQVFGTVAANVAHVTFAESVALVELGSKFEKGSEAGTRFRNILLQMTNIKPIGDMANAMRGMGVNIATVTNRALPLYDRLKEISKIKGNSQLMEGLFEKRNIAMAAGLFSRLDQYQNILAATDKNGIAESMANINVNNITGALEQFRDKWQNIFITSTEANGALSMLKGTIQFLTNHLDGLVTVGVVVLDIFLAWKGYIIGARIALTAFNFIAGIATVINGQYATSCFASIAGMNGMAFASYFLEASLLELTLMTGGVLVALGLIYFAFTDNYDASTRFNGSLDKTKDGFTKIKEPITQAQIAMDKYNDAMASYNEMQDFKAHRDYAYNQSFLRGFAFTLTHSYMSALDVTPGGGGHAAPNKADYPALESNPKLDQVQSKADSNEHASNVGSKQLIELHINNNTGHSLDVDDTGAPGIKISSTTNSWAS